MTPRATGWCSGRGRSLGHGTDRPLHPWPTKRARNWNHILPGRRRSRASRRTCWDEWRRTSHLATRRAPPEAWVGDQQAATKTGPWHTVRANRLPGTKPRTDAGRTSRREIDNLWCALSLTNPAPASSAASEARSRSGTTSRIERHGCRGEEQRERGPWGGERGFLRKPGLAAEPKGYPRARSIP